MTKLLREALEAVDLELGRGYARKNPALVGALLVSYGLQGADVLAEGLADLSRAIASLGEDIKDSGLT